MSESMPIAELDCLPGPGDVFGGGYEILRILGEGGMGRVALARESAIHRNVAIKILKKTTNDSERAQERFFREGRVLGSLRAPGIVPIFHAGKDPETGQMFLVLEAEVLTTQERERVWREWTGRDCPGARQTAPDSVREAASLSLADLLDEGHTIPEPSVVRLGGELVEALSVLHGHEPTIVHRDLKPSNLLFGPDGHVRITDFGIAKSLGPDSTDLTLPGTAPGTWLWAAPEQKAGKEPSPATDVHAVGLILYRSLTGGLPLPGGELPLDVAPRVARAWRPLFRTLLADDPAERPSLAEIRIALGRIRRAVRRRESLHRLRRTGLRLLAVGAAAALLVASYVRCHSARSDDSDPSYELALAYATGLTNGLVTARPGEALTLHEGQTFSVADMDEPGGSRPSRIILDGGRILFSRPTKELRTAIDGARRRHTERRSGGSLEEILASEPYPLRDESFFIPIELTEKGGIIQADDLSVDHARIRGSIVAPPDGAMLSVRSGSMHVIVLDQAALGPGVSIAEHSRGKIIDFSTMRTIRWLDD